MGSNRTELRAIPHRAFGNLRMSHRMPPSRTSQDEVDWNQRRNNEREDRMTSRHDSFHTESGIDRRLFLGAAGALTVAGQSALAQETNSESRPVGAAAKRLSDTIADFVVGFDPTTLPPPAIERVR